MSVLRDYLRVMTIRTLLTAFLFPILLAGPAFASPPVVETVKAEKVGMGWRFDVTIRHADTGWDHFADGWDVVDAQGQTLGYRELMHPHVTEQPFTRSLSNVLVPDGVRTVWVRVRCNEDGWASKGYEVRLDPGY